MIKVYVLDYPSAMTVTFHSRLWPTRHLSGWKVWGMYSLSSRPFFFQNFPWITEKRILVIKMVSTDLLVSPHLLNTKKAFFSQTPDTYYRYSSSASFVRNVTVPLLCISALDDPLCTKEAIPYDECRSLSTLSLSHTHRDGIPPGIHFVYLFFSNVITYTWLLLLL